MGEFDVLEKMVIERRVCKFEDRFGDIVARSFNWDIVVFFEVDTGLLLGWIICDAKKLTL